MMNQQNSVLTEPIFEARDIELMAVAVMQLLSNKSISVKLKPNALKHVESLAHALKTGNKSKVFQLFHRQNQGLKPSSCYLKYPLNQI